MLFRTGSLCQKLNEYEKVIVYGTGSFARQIYPRIVKHGLKDKVLCFTQSEMGNMETDAIDGKPIVSLNALDCAKTGCVVLVAVSELYVDEIKKVLLQFGYLNHILLTEYITSYKEMEQKIYGLSDYKDYCEHIADWYIETHTDNLSKEIVVRNLLRREENTEQHKDTNLIVMISGYITSRSIKIINTLKKRGFDIVVLNYERNTFEWYADSLKKIDIQVHKCHCIEEMLYKALQYSPKVYFFEPRWGDSSWAEIMIRNKKHFGKIIFALYDVLNDGYLEVQQEMLITEKYSLENADGIVWRWFSKDYLERKGFRYKGKSIQFLDYCDFGDSKPLEIDLNSHVLKLCMVNSVGDTCVEDRPHQTSYTDWARIGEILAVLGNREDCVFHFYTGRLKEENIERCREYEKRYPNFKLYLNTPRDELIEKLKQYDYGCDLYIEGEWPPDEACIGRRYKGSCWNDGVRNTFFEFINAGLPIVAVAPRKFIDYLQKYDIVVQMDISNMNFDYLREREEYYKKNVETARKELNIDSQISRLIEFMEGL